MYVGLSIEILWVKTSCNVNRLDLFTKLADARLVTTEYTSAAK
jgi:hypothetical protein